MENTRSKIILVDDNKANLSMGRNMLKTFYEVYPAPSAAKLFEILRNVIPDLILLDIEMPEMNGYEAMKKLKEDPHFAGIPVIFLTSKNDEDSELRGLELGAVDYVYKPFSAPLLLKRIENHLLLHRHKKALLNKESVLLENAELLSKMVQEKTQEIVNLQYGILTIVTEMVEFRDKHTGGHITRTKEYLKALTDQMIQDGTYAEEISKWDMEAFLSSAPLHDLGKVTITDLILNKPGKLTPEEFEIMKTHVTEGIDAVERILQLANEHVFLRHALLTVGTHHEKWDGSGYPLGLRAKNIPLEGRLMAIADVYDALISKRSYKDSLTHEEACRIIEEGAGKHFDPVLVDVFKKIEDKFEKIAHKTETKNAECE